MKTYNRIVGKRARSGFSLIELMIAMLIFVTCLLSIFAIFPYSMQALNKGKYTFLATQVAQKELEFLKNQAWADLDQSSTLVSTYTTNHVTSLTSYVNSSTPIVINFYPSVNVSSVSSNVKNIRVTVKYSTDSSSPTEDTVRGLGVNYVTIETMVYYPQ